MTTIVRLFVLALTVSGAAAFTYNTTSSKPVLAQKASSMPRPNCAPSDPTHCGM